MRDFVEARRMDFMVAMVVFAAFAALVMGRGDVLFLGLWYYAAVVGGTLALSLLINPRPLFASGAVIAAGLSLAVYVRANWNPTPDSGLVGLGHLFSLPCAAIGLLLVGFGSRLLGIREPYAVIASGAAGFVIGFVINQAYVCDELISCRILFS
ncbi:hypothetical protein [Pseudomonas tohonis]|uniref:hypothetical protein n=1 Tax=Pseudomonas tohonis TaxID=2725477 RepID=UPI001F1DA82E|nr:hypothetical protein [Pseudomonas tohonis]